MKFTPPFKAESRGGFNRAWRPWRLLSSSSSSFGLVGRASPRAVLAAPNGPCGLALLASRPSLFSHHFSSLVTHHLSLRPNLCLPVSIRQQVNLKLTPSPRSNGVRVGKRGIEFANQAPPHPGPCLHHRWKQGRKIQNNPLPSIRG